MSPLNTATGSFYRGVKATPSGTWCYSINTSTISPRQGYKTPVERAGGMGQCRYESVRKGPRVSFTWVVGAGIVAVASFVFGLTGFGISLVSVSLLPFFVPLATVVPLITLYGAAFALVMTIQLRRDVMFPQLV